MHESSNSGGNMPYMEEPPSYISLYPELANAGYSRPTLQVTSHSVFYSRSFQRSNSKASQFLNIDLSPRCNQKLNIFLAGCKFTISGCRP